MAQAFISFQQLLNLATKHDRHWLEDSCAVYDQWYQQWILMAADDARSTIMYVILLQCSLPQLLRETRQYMRPVIICGNMVINKVSKLSQLLSSKYHHTDNFLVLWYTTNVVVSLSPNHDAIDKHYAVYLCGVKLSYMINGGLLHTFVSLYSHMNVFFLSVPPYPSLYCHMSQVSVNYPSNPWTYILALYGTSVNYSIVCVTTAFVWKLL